MKVIRILGAALLIATSAWYYSYRVDQMRHFTQFEKSEVVEVVELKEPQILFGMVVDELHVEAGRIRRNQNLSDILSDHNVDPLALSELARASRKVYDVRKIRANTPFTLVCLDDSLHTAKALFYEPNPIDYVAFHFRDSVRVELHQRPVNLIEKTSAGTIKNEGSLATSMSELGLSPQLTNDFADIFAWQIDFFKLYPGDQFKVIYQEKYVDGNPVGLGKIIGASFKHNQEDHVAVFYDQGNGIDYFDLEGNSLAKSLLKFPLEFTRISSRYTGRRFHPVQKVYKAHLGTDFAAPTNTPIRTVGDGVIVEARYHSANGNYVKVKHNGIYTTQYLHMNKIATGIRPGVKVKRGQTIGYVGSTGLARGSHLCFRFWKNGVQVDALRVEIPPSQPIFEENLQNYELVKQSILKKLDQIEVPAAEFLAGGM